MSGMKTPVKYTNDIKGVEIIKIPYIISCYINSTNFIFWFLSPLHHQASIIWFPPNRKTSLFPP